jgi:hypothetical protein
MTIPQASYSLNNLAKENEERKWVRPIAEYKRTLCVTLRFRHGLAIESCKRAPIVDHGYSRRHFKKENQLQISMLAEANPQLVTS